MASMLWIISEIIVFSVFCLGFVFGFIATVYYGIKYYKDKAFKKKFIYSLIVFLFCWFVGGAVMMLMLALDWLAIGR